MSSGGVFYLVANDGKADQLILATKLLNQRIKSIICARQAQRMTDEQPTLQDIERTHMLWINRNFKPHAAIAHEYNKVRPSSGTVSCGGSIAYSIPQFGDFFHDMVALTRFDAFAWETKLTPQQSAAPGSVFPFGVATPLPLVLNGVAVSTFYNIVDACGNRLVDGVNVGSQPNASVQYRNLARYCEYPGNRLFRSVRFDVNGNPLDAYSDNVSLMLEKFTVSTDKRAGYNRLTGQENPLDGYGHLMCCPVVDNDIANTPAGILPNYSSGSTHGLFDGAVSGGLGPFVSLNSKPAQVDFARSEKRMYNGPQTPKPMQPPLEIWHKLRFWFNDDVQLSIPSVCIPYGQRFITVDVLQAEDIIHEEPGIYLETITETVTNVAAGPPIVYRTDRVKTYTPIFVPSSTGWANQALSMCRSELHINNIFVNPEVHDIYISRVGFSLVRVYREHIARTTAEGGDEKLLSSLKWPIEYMMVGLRPSYNVSTMNRYRWRDWHRLTRMVNAYSEEPSVAELSRAVNGLASSNVRGHLSVIGTVGHDEYAIPIPTVDTLALTAHGVAVYDVFSSAFYNSYLPTHYGMNSIITPKDPGALFVNFALVPRKKYQPSGHLNISRARETYIKYTSTYASCKTQCDLIVVAIALNFLLITDGSAVLRYST